MKMKFCNYLRLCGLLPLLLFAATDAIAVRYVKPVASGAGNGSSWANASSDLQAMINASPSDEAVWVAAGTYKPTAYPTGCVGCSTDRDFAFSVKAGVRVYGGFAGTETNYAQRTPSNISILSGDIGIPNMATDNVYHVVVMANVTGTLDGFTIVAGNANGFNAITLNTQTLSRSTGGGILAQKAICTLNNNIITTNNSAGNGGGIYAQNSSQTLMNCVILNNTATDGGGFYAASNKGSIVNTCFVNNAATGNGGGIYVFHITETALIDRRTNFFNNTFSSNSAGLTGGGIYTNSGSGKMTTNALTNNIFWGNKKGTATNIVGADYANATAYNYNRFKNNLLQLPNSVYVGSSYGLGVASGNKFGVNPLFANALDVAGSDGLHRTEDDGLFLRYGSPAMEAGILESGVPFLDIRGFPRTPINDMGAYEGIARRIFYVKPIASGFGDGSSWANASNNLQAMINTVGMNGQVWIAAGTYKPTNYPSSCFNCSTPRDNTFRLSYGSRVYGGFAGTEEMLSQRNIGANPTILSGDIGVTNVAADNCYHVVTIVFPTGDVTSKTVLDGVTVSGGNANAAINRNFGGYAVSAENGAGIYLLNGSNTISNCVISDHVATSGAGLSVTNSNITVSNSFFLNNNASKNGGGISVVRSSAATFTNNVFSSNWALLGGGMYSQSGTNSLFNNTFVNNTASNGGNTQQWGSTQPWGGAFFSDAANNKLVNNLFWGNKRQALTNITGADMHSFASVNDYRYNLLQSSSIYYNLGLKPIGNKFELNPLFANAADIDGADNRFFTADDGLRLQTGSLAIRAGYTMEMPATDIRGIARTTTCDVGAYQGIFGQIREAAPVGEATIKTDAKKDEIIQPNVLNVLPTTSFKKSTSVRVYPTQVQDVLFVEGAATYRLINVATGQVLLQSIENQLHIAHLPKGMYIVQGNDLQGLPFAVKIVLN